LLWAVCRHHRDPDPRFCGEDVSGAVEQWLAAQAAGDVAGLVDGCLGHVGIASVQGLLGVIEQAKG
jgi:hypothetical protein